MIKRQGYLHIALCLALTFAVVIGFDAERALAANTLISSAYLDTNSDGRVDHLKWTFDENITQCNYEKRDWTVDIIGDMRISITGINMSDPEGTGEGACNGTDPVIYLSILADFGETGSLWNPVVSYRNKYNADDLMDSSGISDKTRKEQIDNAKPLVMSTDLNLNDNISEMTVNFTEKISATSNDENAFHINNATKENGIALSQSTTSKDGTSLYFSLTEEQLVAALVLSGVIPLDSQSADEAKQEKVEETETVGGADEIIELVLDIDAAAVKDISQEANANKASINHAINEIADTKAPELVQWDLDLNKNQIILTFSETVDPSTFDPKAISMQGFKTSSSNKVLITGGDIIEIDEMTIALNLIAADINSIKSEANLATSSANAFLAVTNGLIDDLAQNNNIAIVRSSTLQANSYVGAGLIGELSRAHLLLTNNRIREMTKAVVNFEVKNDLPADGKIEVIFPSVFDLNEVAWAEELINMDGNLDVSVSGQTVTIAREGDGLVVPAGTHLSFTLSEIKNPNLITMTSGFTFKTKTVEGYLIDENNDVSGQKIILVKIESPTYEGTIDVVASAVSLLDDIMIETASPFPTFYDISNHWAKVAINKIAELGIVQGKKPGQYAPDDNISRAELLKVVVGAFEYEIPEVVKKPLPDVPIDSWYAPYVKSAFDNNIIYGFTQGLSANVMASRGMTVTVMAKAAGFDDQANDFFESSNDNNADFPDVPKDEYYAPYVAYLHEKGIIDGYEDGTFGPNNPITRAEIAKIVVNILETFIQAEEREQ